MFLYEMVNSEKENAMDWNQITIDNGAKELHILDVLKSWMSSIADKLLYFCPQASNMIGVLRKAV